MSSHRLRIAFVTNNYTPYSGGVVQSINATSNELSSVHAPTGRRKIQDHRGATAPFRSVNCHLDELREQPAAPLHIGEIAFQLILATQACLDETSTQTLRIFPPLVGMVANH